MHTETTEKALASEGEKAVLVEEARAAEQAKVTVEEAKHSRQELEKVSEVMTEPAPAAEEETALVPVREAAAAARNTQQEASAEEASEENVTSADEKAAPAEAAAAKEAAAEEAAAKEAAAAGLARAVWAAATSAAGWATARVGSTEEAAAEEAAAEAAAAEAAAAEAAAAEAAAAEEAAEAAAEEAAAEEAVAEEAAAKEAVAEQAAAEEAAAEEVAAKKARAAAEEAEVLAKRELHELRNSENLVAREDNLARAKTKDEVHTLTCRPHTLVVSHLQSLFSLQATPHRAVPPPHRPAAACAPPPPPARVDHNAHTRYMPCAGWETAAAHRRDATGRRRGEPGEGAAKGAPRGDQRERQR